MQPGRLRQFRDADEEEEMDGAQERHDQIWRSNLSHSSEPFSRIDPESWMTCERDFKDLKRFSTALGGPRKSLRSLLDSADMPQILRRSVRR